MFGYHSQLSSAKAAREAMQIQRYKSPLQSFFIEIWVQSFSALSNLISKQHRNVEYFRLITMELICAFLKGKESSRVRVLSRE